MTEATVDKITVLSPNCGIKKLVIETGTTVEAGTDTATLTLADYGLTKILSVYGVYQSTTDSVMVQESCTTAVSGGVLTITTIDVGGDDSTDNKKRVYTVLAR